MSTAPYSFRKVALIVGLPYKVLELLGIKVTGWLLLVTPRLLLCVLSFVIDVIVYRIVGKFKRHHRLKIQQENQEKALLVFASSWPTLVFMCRPFSNTVETMVLALCFSVLYLVNPTRHIVNGMLHVQTLLLGTLLAVGVFTRFTFPVFFFPLGVELVRQQDAMFIAASRKKDMTKLPSLLLRFTATFAVVAQGFLAFMSWATVFIVMDTLYYFPELFTSKLDLTLFEKFAENVVIAPLNNLVYNTQYANLELHGVHSRLSHLIVNMPMLFGPVFLIFLTRFLRFPNRSFFGRACVFFPLICLSLAPHQEPRFLLPLIVPLHLFTAASGTNGPFCFLTNNRFGKGFWMAFNLTLTLFFGVLHQGGVVPMLLSLSSIANVDTVANPSTNWLTSYCTFNAIDDFSPEMIGDVPLIFAKTYMPPRFLLTGMRISPNFQVIDIAGTSSEDLAWRSYLDPAKNETLALLVLPASVEVKDIISFSDVLKVSNYGRCFPHISTEAFSLHSLSLQLYFLNVTSEDAP